MPRDDAIRSGGRFLALSVPAFPLAALLRADASLEGRAVAVAGGWGNAARVVAVSRAARKAGVRPGMRVPRARALLPALLVLPRDPEAERSSDEALREAVSTVSPRIGDTGEGLVVADLGGTERLASSERDLARTAILAAGRRGLPVRAGVASSRLVARLAASRTGVVSVVPPGGEGSFLAPLPVGLLEPSRKAAKRLRQWGVGRIGDLARLPAAEVAARLGCEGEALHRAARGIDPGPFVPVTPPETVREGVVLDWPVRQLERLLGEAERPIGRIAARLTARGRGCRLLELEIGLETGETVRRAIRLPRPTAEASTLLDLAGLELERRPPDAPVTALVLVAHPARVPRAQLTLFGPEALSPQKTAAVVARLAAAFGPERAGSPDIPDSHVPTRPRPVPFDPPPAREISGGSGSPPAVLALRRVDPPCPLEVTVGGREGRPLSLRTPPGAVPRFQGAVKVASGPWALDSGWWDTPAVRAGWDVELSHGVLLRIHHDRSSGGWFLDGVYD